MASQQRRFGEKTITGSIREPPTMVKASPEYYNLEKVAEVLSVPAAEVNRLREQSKLRGFRDGSNWKFLKDDVHNYLADMIKARKGNNQDADEDDDSDFDLDGEESSFELLVEDSILPDEFDLISLSSPSQKSDLDLAALDDDSEFALADETQIASPDAVQQAIAPSIVPKESQAEKSSVVMLAESGASESLSPESPAETIPASTDPASTGLTDDSVDDYMESSSISLASDSEIYEVSFDEEDVSILSPAGSSPQLGLAGDSGFDVLLEAELEESDFLLEDDDNAPSVFSVSEEFSLVPPPNTFDDDDSESSSQVIAIDMGLAAGLSADEQDGLGGFGGADFGDAGLGAADLGGVDFGIDVQGGEYGANDPFGRADDAMPNTFAMPPTPATASKLAAVPEEEYSTGMLIFLVSGLVLLLLPGIMLIDSMAHVWSSEWGHPYLLNSVLMETIADLFGL